MARHYFDRYIWLIETIQQHPRILFEKIPSSQKWLTTLVNAMRSEQAVELKVTAGQVKYFESLPLHASQEVVESTPEYTLFRYRLVPTYDFKQEILRHGPRVEVLAPDWFRDELRSDIEAMARHYAQ